MTDSLELHVKRVRQEFDDAFKRRPAPVEERAENFVRLTCAGNKYVVAIEEVALLQNNSRIVPLPSTNPRLLGLCSVRGELLAVFDTAAFLGRGEHSESYPWIVRVIGTTAAFAFERCDGQVQGRRQVTGKERFVDCNGELWPLLSLAELMLTVRQHNAAVTKEVG